MNPLHRLIRRTGRELRRVPGPLAYNPADRLHCPLGALIAYRKAVRGEFYFVQVGANDGVRADPIHPFVDLFGLTGVLLEPQPDLFAALTRTYAHRPDLTLINAALAATDGTLTLYRVANAASSDWTNGVATTDRATLLKHADRLPGLAERVEELVVPAIGLATLTKTANIAQVDLLQIDTEGFDYEALKIFDIPRTRPAIIHYEHKHLSRADWAASVALLLAAGYAVDYTFEDTLACRKDLLPAA